jgi:hypothetical protein
MIGGVRDIGTGMRRRRDWLTSDTMIPLIRSRRLAVPGAHEAREGLRGVQREGLLEHY